MYDHDYDTMKSVLSLANMAIEISPHSVSSCAECETEIQVKPRKRACCSLFRGIFCGKKIGPESTTIEGAVHAKLQHLAKVKTVDIHRMTEILKLIKYGGGRRGPKKRLKSKLKCEMTHSAMPRLP